MVCKGCGDESYYGGVCGNYGCAAACGDTTRLVGMKVYGSTVCHSGEGAAIR